MAINQIPKCHFRGFGLARQIWNFSKTQAKMGVFRGVSNSQIQRFFEKWPKTGPKKPSPSKVGAARFFPEKAPNLGKRGVFQNVSRGGGARPPARQGHFLGQLRFGLKVFVLYSRKRKWVGGAFFKFYREGLGGGWAILPLFSCQNPRGDFSIRGRGVCGHWARYRVRLWESVASQHP